MTLADVVGAQLVGVPAQVAQDRILVAQKAIMAWLAGIFGALWACINGLVYVFYKRNEFTPPVASPATSVS
jgi:ABC-type uncharacterized transport system permease subunit